MSTVTRAVCFLTITIIFYSVTDISASLISDLDVPAVMRNDTGPVDLSCSYQIRDDENGLVIKWYHDFDQIYQWIPPMPPQDVGVIKGLVEYPEENLSQPNSRSVIRLKRVTVKMTGKYTCTISTFQEEATKSARMVVYVPENNTTILVQNFNDTHINLTCVVSGAQPRPILKLYIEGSEIGGVDIKSQDEDTRNDFLVKGRAIFKNFEEPILIECEITIPDTDYKRRERLVYYPRSYKTSSTSKQQIPFVSNVSIVLISVIILRF